ncbi:MAG: hypothetical protein P1P90_01825 [Patescibacteria group bacterium]|nr:hypothetical protein [Patescibacteria group bacterium]
MSIQEDLQLWREAKTEADKQSTKANNQLASLQERIKSGKTTGDKLTDFIICCFSGNFEVEPKLRNIESRLQGKTGQVVICIDETEEAGKKNSAESSAYLFRYNKLIGADLDFNFQGELIFPTRKMQMVDYQYSIEGGIFNSIDDVLKLSAKQLSSLLEIRDISRAGQSLEKQNAKVHLLIGDQELMEWLNSITARMRDQELSKHFRSQMALMAHMAGHDLSTLPELKNLLLDD